MNIDTILASVGKPSQYLGNEFNRIGKDWRLTPVRMALVFPDLYEIGMSHQGLQILYRIVNGQPGMLAERAYVPELDMEALLRRHGQPLFALESRRPLADFDLIGITLPYELCYSNILTVLDLAGLPLRAAERDDSMPLIIGGGPCAFNPEPVADFFDAILLGDGEEAIVEIGALIKTGKEQGLNRAQLLAGLSEIAGVYVPSRFAPRYDAQGRVAAIDPVDPARPTVRRRFLADLDGVKLDLPPLVPLTRIVHDRLGVEIARGCTRGCRFCQAGIIYRPVRERSPQRVLELAREGIAAGGFEELALLSLSTGDYSCLGELVMQLMNSFAEAKVSVSMPSMRVGTLTPEIMEQIRRVRKTGFTVAPEAGSERLRRVINKGISEEDLLATCESAFELGWRLIKFYFMVGLPTETDEDVVAIAELARRVLRAAGRGGKITVSVGTFVPKPHTPFERQPQLSVEESQRKLALLKERLGNGKSIALKWHSPRQSFLEGVMARGDRRLAAVIEAAWRGGARLDGWSDHFDLGRWQAAAELCDVGLGDYLRERGVDEVLPWQHLDTGVDREFLAAEFQRAIEEAYTPDCRNRGCQQCGLCDFKRIRPVTFNDAKPLPVTEKTASSGTAPELHVKYTLRYARLGPARFLSHLELIQMFFRLFRKIGLPLNFSKGFNPSPKVTFSPALPLGYESEAEHLVVDLSAALADPAATMAQLNAELPEGMKINNIELGGTDESVPLEIGYEIRLPQAMDMEGLRAYEPGAPLSLDLVRKGKSKKLEAGELVRELTVLDERTVRLTLLSEPSRPGIKPLELVAGLVGVGLDGLGLARVRKLTARPVSASRVETVGAQET